ncbi:MAG: RecX family transcriptional regulator [Geminicoccaceae bacterium]
MTAAPRPPTEERLWRRALAYAERYGGTAASLRRVLLRRALRDAGALGLDPGPVQAAVERVVARARDARLVDDSAFAEARARRLVGRGTAPGRIAGRLAGKGVGAETAGAALDRLGAELGDLALRAAVALARRRRLGPWRPAPARPEHRQRDLAVLARAGFEWPVATAVIDAADPEALEARLAEG